MNTLNQLQPGETVIVTRVLGKNEVKKRILDMGIIKGAQIEVIKKAPLGDPVEIKIKGYNLSLRNTEAALVEVCKKGELS
ncbi:MAG: ferrous iron transport protein A [Anaerolineaceae bacterium]|nr:ferrous iron transport protein A [Anaerolineaceae bacterium]